MKNKLFTLLVVLLTTTYSTAQVVTGTLTSLNNQQIQLFEFNGFNNQIIATTTTNESGDFKLSYNSKNFGVGYLMSVDKKPLFLKPTKKAFQKPQSKKPFFFKPTKKMEKTAFYFLDEDI